MERANTVQHEKSDSLGGYRDDHIWRENKFVSMNQAYKKQLRQYSNQIKHKRPIQVQPFWFSKPEIERKRKDVFTTGSTLNQISNRSAYRTISIKDATANLPLIPDLRYENLTSIFGKTPKETSILVEDDDTKSKDTLLQADPSPQDPACAKSNRFRQALENVRVPLKDRRANPYKGNFENEIAKQKQYDVTLEQICDFNQYLNSTSKSSRDSFR